MALRPPTLDEIVRLGRPRTLSTEEHSDLLDYVKTDCAIPWLQRVKSETDKI